MKCAEANTRLSFVTATLNCLWAATPPSFQQYHVNGRAGQVRRGAGVQGVGLVPELTIERGDGIPSCHRPDPSDIEHRAGAALYPHCRIDTELAGDVRSEEHTSELQSQSNLVCRLLLEKKKKQIAD